MRPEKFINVNWYLAQKPYKRLSLADQYYLGICRELYQLIDAVAKRVLPALPLTDEELRWMAYVYTAYFEDRVSSIGFWDSLVAIHKEHFRKRLPFFDAEDLVKQEEEAEDILHADIHYLGYALLVDTHSVGRERRAHCFDDPFLLEVANGVFKHLDLQEEVLVNNSYDDFLTVPDDYYTFRERFLWFTYKSYLTAEWYNELNDDFLLKNGLGIDEVPGTYQYSIALQERERIAFEEASSFSGFFAIDLFAGALRCNVEERKAICELKARPTGIFELEDSGARQLRLHHTGTGEKFLLEKEGLGSARKLLDGSYLRLTLAAWKGRWFLSGTAMQIPCSTDELPEINEEGQRYYQKHYGPYRKRLQEQVDKQRKLALEFFQSDLVEYSNGGSLQKALHDFNEWHGKRSRRKPVYTTLEPDFLKEEGLALYLSPNDVMGFVPGHAQLIGLLESANPDLAGEQLEDALFLLCDEGTGAGYWQTLRKHYKLPGLSKLLGLPLQSDSDFEALLRLHFPWDFSPLRLPEVSLVGHRKNAGLI
ncbi:MAG: DUF3843 family protein [Chitinophagaceae bacterium]|nr:MAG: DUF3843 family protein [Chitinophagaceae bacterium]